MACYENTNVKTFRGERTSLYVCAVTSGRKVDVTLKGKAQDTIQHRGYVILMLEEDSGKEGWNTTSSAYKNLWGDSRLKDLSQSFTAQSYGFARVVAYIYADSNYTNLIATASTDVFSIQ